MDKFLDKESLGNRKDCNGIHFTTEIGNPSLNFLLITFV